MKFWLTSERAGQIILITKGNDMKKGMRIAAAVMAAAFSMTVLAGCGKRRDKDSGDDGSGFSGQQQRGRDSGCF